MKWSVIYICITSIHEGEIFIQTDVQVKAQSFKQLLSIAGNLHHLPVKVQPLIQIYNEYLPYNVKCILMTHKTQQIIFSTT